VADNRDDDRASTINAEGCRLTSDITTRSDEHTPRPSAEAADDGYVTLPDGRRIVDRRRRPTPLFSRYTMWGRRTRVRRDDDGDDRRYVDRASGGFLALVVALVVLVSFDAFSTLHIVRSGGGEDNPLMDWVLRRSVPLFLAIKLLPLPVAFVLVSIHRYFNWVRIGLSVAVAIYGVLALYHLYGLSQIH
jgi:hypothetical protein